MGRTTLTRTTPLGPYPTLQPAADAQNRTGDISAYSIGAGEYACFKIDQTTGWKQTDGYLYLQANNAEVKIGAIRLG